VKAALFFNFRFAMSKKWATVITDASFCHITKKAGWAAWIRVDGLREPIKAYGSFKRKVSTSINAEKMAAINGVYLAVKHGADAVLLQSDCLSVVHLIDGTTKKQSLKTEWDGLLRQAGVSGVLLSAKHVRGHTKIDDARSYVNRWCDTHANIARKGK
jgi:ribonuclease HI